MRMLTICTVLLLSKLCFPAFDNMVSNDFWNTVGYANPTPSMTTVSMVAAFESNVSCSKEQTLQEDEVFDSWCFFLTEAFSLHSKFISTPLSFVIVVR